MMRRFEPEARDLLGDRRSRSTEGTLLPPVLSGTPGRTAHRNLNDGESKCPSSSRVRKTSPPRRPRAAPGLGRRIRRLPEGQQEVVARADHLLDPRARSARAPRRLRRGAVHLHALLGHGRFCGDGPSPQKPAPVPPPLRRLGRHALMMAGDGATDPASQRPNPEPLGRSRGSLSQPDPVAVRTGRGVQAQGRCPGSPALLAWIDLADGRDRLWMRSRRRACPDCRESRACGRDRSVRRHARSGRDPPEVLVGSRPTRSLATRAPPPLRRTP